ncbi:O-antigen ligase family protein [Flavobacterium psychraquaticum]|uniref:O-antigen ligase family protein n=1 Tax=Flavobacterium psychraquaticum TaxID=3103958 RepID=UPI002ACE3182|nr:O-antigen ligase family protein [Flavobacterium sp. LB-N7T]
MKSTPSLIKIIYFFLFPLLLAYPNKLFEGTYINYIYIFVCFGLSLFLNRNKSFQSNKIISFFWWLFLLVLVANVFSSVLSYNIDISDYIASTLRYLSFFILTLFLFISTKSKHDFLFWIKSFLLGFSLSLIIIVLDSYKIGFIEPTFKITTFESQETLDIYFRAYGAYLSPISAGVFLLNTFVIVNTTMLYINFKRWTSTFLYCILFLIIICIFMTASRTALLGLFIYLLLIALKSKNRIKILIIFLIAGVFIYYSGIIDVYLDNILLRNERESEISNNLLEGSGRIDTFFNSLKLYLDWRTLFFGVGPSEYSEGDDLYSFAHNGFLSLILCYGLLGVICFLNLLSFIYSKIATNTVSKKIFIDYISVNAVCFITSDGPVTYFWIVNFIVFLFFIYKFNYIKDVNVNFR